MYSSLEYIGYWSQGWDGALSPALITAKVKCRLHSHHLYLAAIGMAWSLLDNKRPGSFIHVSASFGLLTAHLLFQSLSTFLKRIGKAWWFEPSAPPLSSFSLHPVLTTNSNLVTTKHSSANFLSH